uniref:Uncharacterized protein n=1 Tax=Timema bartmani TaxID=61472 RepID=A0A7R9F334_9NEOP|nr:unnamed protein product [Timema bartmani]
MNTQFTLNTAATGQREEKRGWGEQEGKSDHSEQCLETSILRSTSGITVDFWNIRGQQVTLIAKFIRVVIKDPAEINLAGLVSVNGELLTSEFKNSQLFVVLLMNTILLQFRTAFPSRPNVNSASPFDSNKNAFSSNLRRCSINCGPGVTSSRLAVSMISNTYPNRNLDNGSNKDQQGYSEWTWSFVVTNVNIYALQSVVGSTLPKDSLSVSPETRFLHVPQKCLSLFFGLTAERQDTKRHNVWVEFGCSDQLQDLLKAAQQQQPTQHTGKLQLEPVQDRREKARLKWYSHATRRKCWILKCRDRRPKEGCSKSRATSGSPRPHSLVQRSSKLNEYKEVALLVSHSSLMSYDKMKPRSGDWAVTIDFIQEAIYLTVQWQQCKV